MNCAAIAIGAHPDDIEFVMAGTLVRLHRAGWETHYLTIASGSCGSNTRTAAATRRLRRTEARHAASILGARFHASLCDDLEILYQLPLLRRLAAVLRAVQPSIVLAHSPQDYLEDHMNASRLAVSAAFALGMPNFRTTPRRRAAPGEVAIYHAMPHGLCDQRAAASCQGAFVDTTSVHAVKRTALATHATSASGSAHAGRCRRTSPSWNGCRAPWARCALNRMPRAGAATTISA
ncbi:MAG: PIG-L family deacetylase [Planctomycetota bacterium]